MFWWMLTISLGFLLVLSCLLTAVLMWESKRLHKKARQIPGLEQAVEEAVDAMLRNEAYLKEAEKAARLQKHVETLDHALDHSEWLRGIERKEYVAAIREARILQREWKRIFGDAG